VDQALLKAKSYAKKGKVEKARKLYQDVLQAFPTNKRAQKGLTDLNKLRPSTIKQTPPQKKIDRLLNLLNRRQLDDTVAYARDLIKIYPKAYMIWNILGVASAMSGQLDEAIIAFRNVIKIKPNFSDAHYNIGNAFEEKGNLVDASDCFKRAISLKPDHFEAYLNLAGTLKKQGQLEEAVEAFQKVLLLKPDYVDAYLNMGVILQYQGKLKEAIASYNRALSFKPNSVLVYNNLGNALKEQGKLEEAIIVYNKALSINPHSAEVHKNLSFVLLASGKLKQGLEEYEWRWKTRTSLATRRQFSKPLWDGQKSLRGKRILVWCEQGIGDTINWSSILPIISAQAQHCILECAEKLVSLLTRSFPNVEIKPEDKSLDLQRDDFDFHLPMGSLYRHLFSEISDNRKPSTFLIPDPIRVKFWRERLKSLGKGPYVGLSWKSSNMSLKRLPNYAAISEWFPILKLNDITFVNLQYSEFANDLTTVRSEMGVTIHNFDDLDHYNNLDDVAALSAALDVVISTHSAVPIITAGVGTITKLVSWQQSSWNNVLFCPHGPFVEVYQRNTWEPWNDIFHTIAGDVMSFNRKYKECF
jgi:tetratricopeptide (TPR) repeat protein